jgi:hypothetical protein
MMKNDEESRRIEKNDERYNIRDVYSRQVSVSTSNLGLEEGVFNPDINADISTEIKTLLWGQYGVVECFYVMMRDVTIIPTLLRELGRMTTQSHCEIYSRGIHSFLSIPKLTLLIHLNISPTLNPTLKRIIDQHQTLQAQHPQAAPDSNKTKRDQINTVGITRSAFG